MGNRRLARALLLLAIALAFSSPSLTPVRTVAAATDPPYIVAIHNEQFNPQTVTTHAGITVMWVNNDPFPYELYFQFSSGTPYALSPFILPGKNFTLSFPACNTFQYVTIQSPVTITGSVKALLQGDVNGDGVVNFLDLGAVGAAFLSTPASPNWNPAADLNNDGVVNFLDLGLVGQNFLQHC